MSDAGVRRHFQPSAMHPWWLAAAVAASLATAPAAGQPTPAPTEPAALLPAASGAASSPDATPPALTDALAALRRADEARAQQVAQLQEQLKHLRGQVEWHEAVLPWMGAALALLAGGLGLLASWSARRQRSARPATGSPHAPASPAAFGASTSRPGSLPAAGDAATASSASGRPAGPASQPAGVAGAGPQCAAGRQGPVNPAAANLPDAPTAAQVPALLERPEFVSSTRPVPQLFSTPATPAPLLSADALIDLEQQADFFVALGQEQAAVERLLAELRTVEGRSPMPWLKLLEIHRRQGDRASYQRALDRFRQRFGPHGAEWTDPHPEGRPLEDHAEAMARLQALWPVPQDVMALLERLVGGCEPNSVLSLAASQDALLLYQLARSFLPETAAQPPAPDVDLLLPMDSAAALSGRAARGGRVDLDLSSGVTPLA
ncbi:hypothetical protein [Aquincola tertiaricarbonis]|uniref:hypothetical protein n=1 Tax=Aquincola tertiaricarbonis TaxID=391953 RepID=UPI0012ED27A1|nr:hypothetical protein [Aquincola tertiaricarbonis]